MPRPLTTLIDAIATNMHEVIQERRAQEAVVAQGAALEPVTTPPPPAPNFDVPPLANWLNKGLYRLIQHAPKNPVIRGKIRQLYHIIPPKDLEPTTESWEKYIMDNFGSIPIEIRPEPRNPNDPYLNESGQLVVPHATVTYSEAGRANFAQRVINRLNIIVPSEVVARGYEHVVEFVRLNAASMAPYTTERADEIEYSAHAVTTRTITDLNSVTNWSLVGSIVNNQRR